MVEVESTNVAAIGYLPEYRLLRVRFHDGSTYDYPNISEVQHVSLMAAPSKGKAIAELRRHGTRLTDDTAPKPTPPPRVENLLQSIEHDECCSPIFARAARSGGLDKAESWTCPKCGVEYKPTLIEGAIRRWTAQVYSILVRPR
jgi:hypothetical protein